MKCVRKIVCRFNSLEDFNLFCNHNNIKIPVTTRMYNFITGEYKTYSIQQSRNPQRDYDQYWVNMPYYRHEEKKFFMMIEFLFQKETDLSRVFDQKITDKTTSVWFPKRENETHTKILLCEHERKPRYPIYVVSRGRHDRCTTSKFLSLLEIEHYVVVEPNEVMLYRKTLDKNYAHILQLDLTYKDNYDTCDDIQGKETGPGPARNFCWDHSIKLGFSKHWVMDDNIRINGFSYTLNNDTICVKTGTWFRIHEDFIDRFDNIAISGLHYTTQVYGYHYSPPYLLNTRIYSFLLIRNDIPYRWRGRYNEDTDLSLRVLKDGWCTLENCAFTADKCTTQTVKGGNNEIFYSKEGTVKKSKMIAELHPDLCRETIRFHREHHIVDYSVFKQKLNPIVTYDKKVNNYDMYIINGVKNDRNLSISELQKKYSCAEHLDFVENEKSTLIESLKKQIVEQQSKDLVW